MLRSIRDLDLRGKRVLIRVDYNVPIAQGRVVDDTRIRESLPTIRYALGLQARVVILAHLGRPKGFDESLRLDPVAARLSKLIGQTVVKLDDCIGEDVEDRLESLQSSEIALLENLRFYDGEERDDDRFARSLAELGDVYVNDAFGVSHRAHASVHAITRYLPSAAGLLLEREVAMLSAVAEPEHPFVAILGGAKVSDKIGVITSLAKRADSVLIGGAMMCTFFKALGFEVGRSLVEADRVPLAKTLLKAYGRKLVLPVDVVVRDGTRVKSVPVDSVARTAAALDIGPKSVKLFAERCAAARTVFWNGPLGKAEETRFAKGTAGVARAVAKLRATTIVGGGDTVAVINRLKLAGRFTHVSTGGGAALEFVEGRRLPGIDALRKKH